MKHSLNVNDILGYRAGRGALDDRVFRYQIKKIDIEHHAQKLAVDLLPMDEEYTGLVGQYPLDYPLKSPWFLHQKFQLEEYV